MLRSYAVTSLATLFLISACIVMLCFTINPYKLYPAIPWLSPKASVDLFYILRLHRPFDVERVQPQILILGSSRSAVLPPRALQALGGVA